MSRLAKLLKELCPNGVEKKKICDILISTSTGLNPRNNFKLNVPNANNYYVTVKEIASGKIVFSDKTDLVNDEALTIIQKRSRLETDDVLLSGIGTIGRVAVVDIPTENWNCSESVLLLKPNKNIIISKYLKYVIESSEIQAYFNKNSTGSTLKGIRQKDLQIMQIPVPPLEVQSEIVKILDNYSAVETELEEKLSAELTARKKQYEYYRDSLISCESEQTTQLIPMSELFDFRNGLSKGKEFFGKGTPFIRYTDVFNHRYLHKSDITERVTCTDSELSSLRVKRGDVFFTRTSETAEEVGYSSVMLDEIEDCVFNGFTIKATPKTDLLLPEYCAYCFSTYDFRNYVTKYCAFTTRASLTGKTIGDYKLAVPSLAVQSRIVNVLDNFEKICNDLSIGLPAEIDARRKQYEYYRDALLSFDPNIYIYIYEIEDSWRFGLIKLLQYVFGYALVKLRDIATITRGGSLQKSDFTEQGLPCIHYGQIYTRYGIFADKTLTFIPQDVYDKQKHAVKNDIVVAVTSENVEDVCECVAWLGDEEIAVSGHTAIIHHNQNAKYLSYFFHTRRFFEQKRKIAHGTKVIEVTPDKLNDILIPLPTLAEQERIVSILDRFDALCNDISEGIPAEIEAHRKQYEYYRDKLLTFKEA